MLLFCTLNCAIADDSVAWIADLSFSSELFMYKSLEMFQLFKPITIAIAKFNLNIACFRVSYFLPVLFFFYFIVGSISSVRLRWMKKTLNKCTYQLLAQNSEIFIIKKRKRKVGKQCRERKKYHHLLFTGTIGISQQLPLKILTLFESNDILSTAAQ